MVYRSTRLKKGLSLLLSIFLILPLITTTAYATEGYDPNATQGSGGNAETITGGTGFSLANQGYRISILSGNNPFPGVAKPVQDMWYSTPPSDVQYKDTNRLGMTTDAAKGNIIGQGNLEGIDIPKAIIVGSAGGFAANGIAVRQYLLGGSGGSPSSPGGSGGTGGTGGGPTINWGGSPTPTRSQLAEKYDIEKDREEQAVNLARYYNNKLKSFYDNAVKDAGTDRGMTPDEFRERLNYYADKYRVEIDNKFANDHDWGVYGDGMEGYVLELLENTVSSLSMAYTIKYNRESQGHYTSTANSRVKGAYIKEGDSILITKEDIPLADAEGGSGEVPLTQIIKALFSDGTDSGEQALVDAINADPEFRILLESIVWYYPRTTSGSLMGIKVAGSAKNIAEFNLEMGGLLGNVNGAGMAYLTNGGLPKGLLTEKDDTVLNILMPTDPGTGTLIQSSAIGSNYGWGSHIYTKGDAGTHTWDKDTYPDGTPGPAPDPGSPSTPSNPGTPSDPGDPSDPSDPNNPGNPNGGYNITIIKFYENNDEPESNFTREHNPGTILVEDEPLYKLVNWFYSPDRIDPPSQSTSYDETKVQALVTGDGSSETTVNVVTPDTTLYLKLVKKDKDPGNPTQEFILKESEVTRAYNSQEVKAGGSWPTGDVFHWEGNSLDGPSCSYMKVCGQLTFSFLTDIIA